MKKAFFIAFIAIVFCLCSINANARFAVHPKVNDAFTAVSCIPLDTIVASTVVDLDATCTGSYNGSGQTWANLVSDTSYDVWLGTTSDSQSSDPTFTGSAGSPTAYFVMDGGDLFQIKDPSGTIFDDFQFTTGGAGAVWVFIAYKAVIDVTQALWGSSDGTPGQGARLLMNTTENYRFLQRGDSASFNQKITADDVVTAIDILVGVTFNTASTGSELLWFNTDTGAAWSNAYSPDTTTTIGPDPFQIGANVSNQHVPNNTRIYGFYAGTGILSNTDAALIRDHIQARHDLGRYASNNNRDDKTRFVSNDNYGLRPKIWKVAA